MLPPEFVDSMAYLYKAFGIVSKIMRSMYNGLDLDEGTDRDILKLEKAVRKRCKPLRARAGARRSGNPGRKQGEFQQFVKKNMRRYRKKYYELSSVDLFKVMAKEWREQKERTESEQGG